MKTLHNHVILYDSNCPLCKAYTGAFVSCGLLDRNGRSAYNQQDPQLFSHLDPDRARNEIALVNTQTHQVTYGLDSLIAILGHHRKAVQGILRFPLVYFPLKCLYSLISYNRKLIAPSASNNDTCVPDFNLFYRMVFLLLANLFTGFVLYHFITPVLLHSKLHTGFGQEMLVVTGQMVFQAAVLLILAPSKTWDYLGHMMAVSVMGALLLLPALLVYSWYGFDFYFALAWFAAVVGTMFGLHLGRCKKLGLGLEISASWILYRVLALSIIFCLS